jgi:hypothetical protein
MAVWVWASTVPGALCRQPHAEGAHRDAAGDARAQHGGGQQLGQGRPHVDHAARHLYRVQSAVVELRHGLHTRVLYVTLA